MKVNLKIGDKVRINIAQNTVGTIISSPIELSDTAIKPVVVRLDEGFWNQNETIYVSCILANVEYLRLVE